MNEEEFEEVFETLRAENRQNINHLKELKKLFYPLSEFDGMSLIGTCIALIKSHLEQQEEIRNLKAQIKKHENKKNKKK